MSDKRRVFWGYWDFPLSPRYFASFPIDQHGIFLVAIATSSTQSTGWKKNQKKIRNGKSKRVPWVRFWCFVFARVSRKNICIVTFNVVRFRSAQSSQFTVCSSQSRCKVLQKQTNKSFLCTNTHTYTPTRTCWHVI